jgi:heme/copper-type cytochrome/quinol oxidase subunit 3
VLNAVVYRLGLLGIRAGSERRFVSAALLALLLVAADAVAQMLQLGTFSFGVGTSAYSSAIYTLAGANLFHLLLTVFIGIAMWNRGRLHIYSQESNWQPQLVSLWWTWIAIASVLGAFATSFISSPNTGH